MQDGIAKLTPVLPNIPLFYCGSRDYLFKAVARINDEDDLNQWFCNENGVVWNRFEKDCKMMTVFFCNKSQAKQMLVEVE